MTATTAPPKAPSTVWIVLLALAAGIVLLAFVGRDDASLGGRADPRGTGREGLAALRIMIEETGGSTILDLHEPGAEHEVAVLGTENYAIAAAFLGTPGQSDTGDSEPAAVLEEVFAPILAWVEAGGLLVTGVDVPGGPESAFSEAKEALVDRGTCTIDTLDGVNEVSMPDHAPLEVAEGDKSCFGDGERAVVVARAVGEGTIVRVAGFEPFFNRLLDEPDNGALAARTIGMGAEPSVAFLSGPDPAVVGGVGGPVDEDGNPIGIGDGNVFDLVPGKVFALLAGLAAAALIYAYAVGRRLGSPVLEPLPIELPSSSYTEAVGRLYARAERPRARSAELLRTDFRTSAARRVGLIAASPKEELATALTLTTGTDRSELVALLDGPDPVTDEQFVALAAQLADQRARMKRGASSLRDRERTSDDRSSS